MSLFIDPSTAIIFMYSSNACFEIEIQFSVCQIFQCEWSAK